MSRRTLPRRPRVFWIAGLGMFAVYGAGGCTGSGGAGDRGAGGNGGGHDGKGGIDGSSNPDEGKEPTCQLELRTPMRRLSRTEFAFSVSDLLGVEAKVDTLPEDELINGYAVNGVVSLQQKDIQDYGQLAREVAVAAVADVDRFADCDLTEAACQETVVRKVGRRFFRRPLSGEEVDTYVTVLDTKRKATDAKEALALMLETMLQSPNFLYRPESGRARDDGTYQLDGFEVASRLSYFLWASGPDDELLDAAAAGALDGSQGIRTQARRMLEDARFQRSLESFQLQWLGMGHAFEAKDGARYPGYDENRWKSRQKEVVALARHFYLDENATMADMLAADFTFGDAELAKLYGTEAPSDSFGRITLPTDRRKGLITSAGFLTAMATQNAPATIRRGVFVRENVLCQHPPPPPPGLAVETPEDDGRTTVRERLAQHRTDPQCAGCHAFFDPLGLALETYGAIGEWRDKDNGLDIDPAGALTDTDLGEEVSFANGVEMVDLLARSTTARGCLPQQWLRYAIGRGLVDSDICALDKLLARYEDGDFALMDMLEAVATSDFVRFTGIKFTEEE